MQSRERACSVVSVHAAHGLHGRHAQPYTEKTDVWALGVLLYELAALRLPFLGKSILDISNLISRGQYPPLPGHYSASLSQLVGEMLQLDEKSHV